MPLALTRPSHGICLVPLAQNAPIPSLSSHQKPQPKTAISPRAVPASYTGNIPASHYHTWWLSFWESESDCIYTRSQSSGDPVQVWTKVPSRHRSQQYQLATTPADTVPLTSICATIISMEPAPPSPNTLPSPTTVPEYPIPLPLLPPSHDIQSFLGDLPPASRWPVQHLHLPSTHTILPYSLRDGTVKAVCDGSWKSPLGTAAFLIGDLRHPVIVLAQGVRQTPPAHPDASLVPHDTAVNSGAFSALSPSYMLSTNSTVFPMARSKLLVIPRVLSTKHSAQTQSTPNSRIMIF